MQTGDQLIPTHVYMTPDGCRRASDNSFNVFETDPNYAGSLGIPTSNTGVNITPDNHHITANIGEPMSAPTGRKSKESFCSAMKIRTLILDTALRKYSLTHWLCYLVFLPAGPSNWVPVRTVVAAPVTQKFEHDSSEGDGL